MSTRRPRMPRVDPAPPPGDAVADLPRPETGAPDAVAAPQPSPPPPSVDEPAGTAPAPAPPGPEHADRHADEVMDPAEPAPAIDLLSAQRRRSGSRPAGASSRPRTSPRAAAEARRRRQPLPEPVPARQLTGRSLLVLAVLLVAMILVAPTLRTYLNQQLQISEARADIAEKKAQQADYEETIRRWDDPAYVAQQARERLDLVMPGETLYTVTGVPSPSPDPASQKATNEPVNSKLPWVEALWDTVVRSSGA